MKDFIKITLALLGMLSIPSVVFADEAEEEMTEEAVAWYDSGVIWYGSLRVGLMSSDSNLSVFDGGSRWGIRGSAEAGERLTALYQFEHNINAADGSLPDGRLSYVGLSGGFGTVTVGQIWSASYNSVGAITDNSLFWGSSQTSGRHGPAISYAFSNDMMSLQIDAIYVDRRAAFDNFLNWDPTKDKQRVEYGLSINVGDLGKVAIAHVRHEHAIFDNNNSVRNPDAGDTLRGNIKTTTLAAEVSVSGLTAYAGTQTRKDDCLGVYTSLDSCDQDTAGQIDVNEKTTFFGVRGGLGDTGLSYLFQWRDVKDSHQPWLLSLTKDLGDNTALVLEHVNYDDNPKHDGASGGNRTGVALAVHF